MMMIRPWRSAKCPGDDAASRRVAEQAPAAGSRAPARSIQSGSLGRAVGEAARDDAAAEADRRADAEAAIDAARMSRSSRAAEREERDVEQPRTDDVGDRERQDRVVAEGVRARRSATRSSAPIAPRIARRTAPSSGLTVFVSHA